MPGCYRAYGISASCGTDSRRGSGGKRISDGESGMKRTRRWLASWSYRIQESLSCRLPKRWHERTCPFCRGANQWLREQRRERERAANP